MPSTFVLGSVFAGFRIESLLAEGAMGVVYAARREAGGERVALKLLAPDHARDERFRQRFLRESQLAASLEHPNVVTIVSSGEADGVLYLAMEYIEGADLREILRRDGRLEAERALALLTQVAAALDAAHAAGLVHRDVKPANVLVAGSEEGERAYVCDFGLARHVSSVSSLTGDRGFVGTIDYVPPEQIQGGPIDARADVYSLGCVLFECLAGERPFARDSELSVVFAHLNEPPPRLSAVRADLPEPLDDVFATALAKSPAERYASCGELVRAADAALHGRPSGRRLSARRRKIAGALAVAVAAVAAASLAAFLVGRGTDAAPVTISPAAIAGGKLGLSEFAYEQLWGNGSRKVSLSQPPGYSMVANNARQVAAYFEGTSNKAVEITTWNRHDRTAEGVGPCSTAAQLRAAYGSRLKAVQSNTQNGQVYGYTVGRNLFFAMGLPPRPTHVEAVALYSNSLRWAGYNALSDGPCGSGGATRTPPAAAPESSAALDQPVTFTTRAFMPGLAVTVPTGRWSAYIKDDSYVFALASPAGPLPSGVQIDFWLDPIASGPGGPAHPAGVPVAGVGRTPEALEAWLRRNRSLVVTAPVTRPIAHGSVEATSVDLDLAVTAPREDPGCPGPCLSYLAFRAPGRAFAFGTGLGEPVRIYFARLRSGKAEHTLMIMVDAPSRKAFDAVLPAATRIVESLRLPAGFSAA